ncbi:GumC family protein [Microvirga brassicacearum]|uniref:Lipopolysaccharide biosynthesis protein n=1 Tax=Microvirga brassicacearum TaxID=2580413 RepID=A0A5N3P624_9HYPH|nr:hypothetical protein [Microvirga brassicacearum]KAB0265172.1 hypothetical protein FEZ63_19685 [Microvirga brassicacearum]
MNNHWAMLGQTTSQPVEAPPPSVWTFLFSRKKLIGWGFATLFLLTTALLYLLPQSYVAEANLLVERNRSPIMRADYSPGLEMAEVMNTARGIASSRTVLAAVVDHLKLTERPRHTSFFGRLRENVNKGLVAVGLLPEVGPRDEWIQALTLWVTIKPIVNSNILTISMSLDDPRLAAEIVNEISSQYIKAHLAIYSTRGLADFYRERMTTAEAEYKSARQEVLDFKAKASLFAISASREEYTRELGTLRTQLLTTSNDLNRLLQRYDERHSEVTVIKDVMANVQTRVDETETKLKKLEQNEAALADMEMLLETKRKTYLDYVNKYGEASVNEQADSDVVNVRLVEKASVPPQPWMPRLFLIFGAGIASLFLAVAVAFLRGYFDGRPNSPDQVERALGIPVVGWLELLPKNSVRALRTVRRT